MEDLGFYIIYGGIILLGLIIGALALYSDKKSPK
jgi:hypothetical protein